MVIKLSREAIVSRLAECKTRPELKERHEELLNSDPVLTEARERRKMHRQALRDREREIVRDEQAPWHDEAKRWKHGDKVYFGKADNRSTISLESLRTTTHYDIKAGEWCRVWQYKPRKRYGWLCRPGMACEYKNVIDHAFSIWDIHHAQISRVEPKLRKDGWR